MLFPTALDLKELVRTPSDTGTIFALNVLNALYTAAAAAVGDGSITTASITIPAGTPEETIRNYYGLLHQAGYTITPVSALVFTLTWQR
jgi:hypothetical protein